MSVIDKKLLLEELGKLDTTMTYVFVDEQRVEQAYRRYA